MAKIPHLRSLPLTGTEREIQPMLPSSFKRIRYRGNILPRAQKSGQRMKLFRVCVLIRRVGTPQAVERLWMSAQS